MKKQTSFTAALVAASVILAAGNLTASDETGQPMPNNNYNARPADQRVNREMKASDLIGKSIKNDQNQTVCEVKDLIVDVDSGRAHYAIVRCGGMAGVGGKRIAIPLNAIQFGNDGNLTIAATKAELESAATAPMGSWASASGQEWTRGVDGYYGQPKNNRFERESAQPFNSDREPVRNDTSATGRNGEVPAAAQQQMNQNNASSNGSPTQDSLQNTVTQTIQQNYGADTANGVHVTVNNGVVTLTGTVGSQSTKDMLENKVQSLSGVQRVDDQLTVQNQ